MMVRDIKNDESPENGLSDLLKELHEKGPYDNKILERLSYYSEFHHDIFSSFEEEIVSAIGLFYKVEDPTSLYSFLLSRIGIEHARQYGEKLTPVQASIRRATETHQFTSISAPTSAGKSYSIRDLIASSEGDAVIIVPSRALIAEYMNAMRRKFENDKGIMILSFVDNVFTSRNLRKLFILTPERSKDLYKLKTTLDISIFFFDEAQITDDKQRGVLFDVMVRRVRKHFPDANLIFAHPFVDNPEAQFFKHSLDSEKGFSHAYPFGTVGKICVFKHKNNGKHYYFSPYIEKGHHISNCVEFEGSFKEYALNGQNTLLVYVSKSSIYKGSFTNQFEGYIQNLPAVSSPEAKTIIEKIQHMLGADNESHRSTLIDLLKKGVVIHHGSVPLEVRFLIEEFIRLGCASICFATNTLAQGINMPFDIVWLENNRFIGGDSERSLAFKNLIGRSGRMTKDNVFDYGYVYTNNPELFSRRINTSFELMPESLIETHELDDFEDDRNELIESIRNDTFDEDKNIPLTKVERLSQDGTLNNAETILDIIYSSDDIRESVGGAKNEGNREVAKDCLRNIYELSIGRSLNPKESAVFENAISIFFHMIQGRSFREIVGIRYSYISDRDNNNGGYAQFSQPASELPDSKHKYVFSLFEEGTSSDKVSYDAIVFDTYDYMDQVIAFSLSDIFIAAFQIYSENRSDERASKIIDLFQYGTNDAVHILLMRYGFLPEFVSEVADYVESIDETRIIFHDKALTAPDNIRDMIEWYLP